MDICQGTKSNGERCCYKAKLNGYCMKHVNINDLTNEECIICYEHLTSDNLRILKCKHYFHKDCIDTWFISNNMCPLCRRVQRRRRRGTLQQSNQIENVSNVSNRIEIDIDLLLTIIRLHLLSFMSDDVITNIGRISHYVIIVLKIMLFIFLNIIVVKMFVQTIYNTMLDAMYIIRSIFIGTINMNIFYKIIRMIVNMLSTVGMFNICRYSLTKLKKMIYVNE